MAQNKSAIEANEILIKMVFFANIRTLMMQYKGKSYKIKTIFIKVDLKFWYLYDIDRFDYKEQRLTFVFLCFQLHFCLEEKRHESNRIGFNAVKEHIDEK